MMNAYYFWNFLNCSEEDFLDPCAEELKKYLDMKDYPSIQAIMNFVNKSDLLWNSNNGCDHSYMAYHIVKFDKTLVNLDNSNSFYRFYYLVKLYNLLQVQLLQHTLQLFH